MASKKTSKTKKTKSGSKTSTRKKKPPYMLILAGLMLGAGALMGFTYVRSRKKKEDVQPDASTVTAGSASSRIKWRDDRLPLVLYSSGPRVLQVQQKLNSKHDAGLVQDSLMGNKTIKALLQNGYPVPLTLEAFNALTDGEATLTFDPRAIASKLWQYSNGKQIEQTLAALRQISTTDQYEAVNKYFKLYKDINNGLVSHSIVNHLLSYAFSTDLSAKELIRAEFSRMGLIERDGVWALSGFGRITKRIVSVRDTYVIDNAGNRIRIKKGTLLGRQLYSSGAMTSFVAVDGGRGMVPSQHVRIL